MHVNGVKRLVDLRGGINSVRQTSPLTARMVSWLVNTPLSGNIPYLHYKRVSMLIMGYPQFDTQDDAGAGQGIPPIPEWQADPAALGATSPLLGDLNVDHEVANVLVRLRRVFEMARAVPLTTTRLHDLACFVIHRLLHSSSHTTTEPSPGSESLRHGIILYLFILQGPTYFSHAVIFNTTLDHFVSHLKRLHSIQSTVAPIHVWFLAVGLVASHGTAHYPWFTETARDAATSLQLSFWDDVLFHVRAFLWSDVQHQEVSFRSHWDAVLDGATACQPEPPDWAIYLSTSTYGPPFIQ